jgi:hypothetical protein
MTARRLACVMVVLAVMWTAGCAGSPSPPNTSTPPATASTPSPSKSPLPPRPTALRLNGLDPCSLLVPAQIGQFRTEPGVSSVNNDGLGSQDCLWHGVAEKPDNIWIARANLTQGAEYYLGSVTGAEIVTVGGFPAVQTTANLQNPKTHCTLFVDVAPGQSLQVQYGNLAGDYPGINHQAACQLAIKAAELMVANLRNLVH